MALFTRPGDRAAIAFPAGHPGGIADGLAIALRRLGAEPLLAPLSAGPVELAAWLRAAKPDVVAGPPVPLLAAARLAISDGGAPLRVRAMLLSSDHVAESLARAIAAACGAEIFEHWGMTETGYGGAVDCAYHCGCHLRENELFVEVVDPETGEPLPPGALGEVVVSTLRRRGVPLLRYRTGDLVRLIEEPCPCGSVLRRLWLRLGAGRRGRDAARSRRADAAAPRRGAVRNRGRHRFHRHRSKGRACDAPAFDRYPGGRCALRPCSMPSAQAFFRAGRRRRAPKRGAAC